MVDGKRLADDVQDFRDAMITFATGGGGDDAEYRRVRKRILEDPALAPIAPQFLRRCRNLSDFWDFIKREHSTYAERRAYLREEIDPLILAVEGGRDPLGPMMELQLQGLGSEDVADVWRKAVARCAHDPDGAVTSARGLLESVCKHVLEDLGIEYRPSDDLPQLYSAVARELNLAPSQHTEKLFKQILGGCHAVVEGLGALRNRMSDAHGSGRGAVRPARRHAELAVNLAGSMATYILATWQVRREADSGVAKGA